MTGADTAHENIGEKLNPPHFNYATMAISTEVDQIRRGVQPAAWARAGALLLTARAVFTVGTGRSVSSP